MHQHPAVALAAAVGRPDAHAGELPVVYVQLKPGIEATEEELLQFAREHIGERAAVPKQVYIVPEVPLTAVGKIFKPALVRQQVADAYCEAVEGLDGVADVTVTARPDKRLGMVAEIQVTAAPDADKDALRQEITRALGQYTIRYDLVIG